MNYLVDVNVWLAMTLIGHAHQDLASKWFEEDTVHSAVFCRVTQSGFLRLLTNANVMRTNVVSAAEAWKLYETLFQDSRVRFAPEPHGIEDAWRTQTRAHHQGHNFWTDAYLAAFASVTDLTLLTFDRTFARRKGVLVRVLA